MTSKNNVDFAIQEWMNLCPQLREDLKITFQKQKGEVTYTIEDPINSRYYRVGLLEYKFISLLDGKKKTFRHYHYNGGRHARAVF